MSTAIRRGSCGERLADKRKVTDAKGRTLCVGGLRDRRPGPGRRAGRNSWGSPAGAGVPILLVYGSETPRRSLAEIEALAALAGVQTARLARGKLSVYEEFPDEVAAVLRPFLAI